MEEKEIKIFQEPVFDTASVPIEVAASVSFRHFRRRDPRTLVFRGVLRSLCVVRTDLV